MISAENTEAKINEFMEDKIKAMSTQTKYYINCKIVNIIATIEELCLQFRPSNKQYQGYWIAKRKQNEAISKINTCSEVYAEVSQNYCI